MNDEQSLLNIYKKMISSDEIEKNKSQEKLVSFLEALKINWRRVYSGNRQKLGNCFQSFFQHSPLKKKWECIFMEVLV